MIIAAFRGGTPWGFLSPPQRQISILLTSWSRYQIIFCCFEVVTMNSWLTLPNVAIHVYSTQAECYIWNSIGPHNYYVAHKRSFIICVCLSRHILRTTVHPMLAKKCNEKYQSFFIDAFSCKNGSIMQCESLKTFGEGECWEGLLLS